MSFIKREGDVPDVINTIILHVDDKSCVMVDFIELEKEILSIREDINSINKKLDILIYSAKELKIPPSMQKEWRAKEVYE